MTEPKAPASSKDEAVQRQQRRDRDERRASPGDRRRDDRVVPSKPRRQKPDRRKD